MCTKSGAAKPMQNPSAKQLQSISWEQHPAGAVLGAPSVTASITNGAGNPTAPEPHLQQHTYFCHADLMVSSAVFNPVPPLITSTHEAGTEERSNTACTHCSQHCTLLHPCPTPPALPPQLLHPRDGQTPTSHPHQPQLLGQIQSLPVSAAKRELSRHAELTSTIPPTSLTTQLSITPRNAPFCPMAAPVPTSRKGTAPILADLI